MTLSVQHEAAIQPKLADLLVIHDILRQLLQSKISSGYVFDPVGYSTLNICNFKQDSIAIGVLFAEIISKQLVIIAGHAGYVLLNLIRIDEIRMLVTTILFSRWVIRTACSRFTHYYNQY